MLLTARNVVLQLTEERAPRGLRERAERVRPCHRKGDPTCLFYLAVTTKRSYFLDWRS